MIPRASRLRSALLVVLAIAGPVAAGADPADTILRPQADEAEPAFVLGPTRLQGEFGDHLDALLAAETDPEPPATMAPVPTAKPERQPPPILPVLGGAVGGTIGLYGGGVLGFLLAEREGHEWGDLNTVLVGATIGEIVLLPLGVHLGNARKGSFAADLGISALGAAAGLGVQALSGRSTPGFFAGAGLQLALVTYAERHGASRRIARAARVP